MMYRHNQVTTACIFFGAGHLEQWLALKLESVAQNLPPQAFRRFFGIRLIADINHMGDKLTPNNRLTGLFHAVINNGRAEHFMFGCHSVQSSGQLRFVGQYIQFENSDNAVRPAFGVGQVFEQHAFLHWRQGVDTLNLLVPGCKVLHHRAEFALRPLGFAQIRRSILFFGQTCEIICHIAHVPEDIPDKAFDLFLVVNPAVIGHIQPEPAAFHQRIEGEVIAKIVSSRQRRSYGNIRRTEHTVTGCLFGIHFAEIVKTKAGNAITCIGEGFLTRKEA